MPLVVVWGGQGGGKAQARAALRNAGGFSRLLALDEAIQLYARDPWGRKPRAIEDLVEPTCSLPLGASYLEADRIPLDPWGRPFEYRPPSTPTGDDYDILSYGKDGVEGGEDPARDVSLAEIRRR